MHLSLAFDGCSEKFLFNVQRVLSNYNFGVHIPTEGGLSPIVLSVPVWCVSHTFILIAIDYTLRAIGRSYDPGVNIICPP